MRALGIFDTVAGLIPREDSEGGGMKGESGGRGSVEWELAT